MTSILQLIQLVRRQTETTNEELPDAYIDTWLQEGFNRTIAGQVAWPFYEKTWEIVQEAGKQYAVMPSDMSNAGIRSVRTSNGRRLRQINQENAETVYEGSLASSAQCEYSVWGGQMFFWPLRVATDDTAFMVRGYRRPATWPTDYSKSPDCDSRLHLPLAHYATALAYAQQEDETLETVYMTRWQRDVEMAADVIMEPGHQFPLIMGPTHRGGFNRPRFTIEVPGGS